MIYDYSYLCACYIMSVYPAILMYWHEDECDWINYMLC